MGGAPQMIQHLPAECPLCGAAVSESRFAELQGRIHEEERKKLEEAMKLAGQRLDQMHREQLEAQALGLRKAFEQREAERESAVDVERERLALELKARHEEGVARAIQDSRAFYEDALKIANDEKADLRRLADELNASFVSAAQDRQTQVEAARAEGASQAAERVGDLSAQLAIEAAEHARLEQAVTELQAKGQELAQKRDADQQAAIAEAEGRHQEELAQQRAALEKDRDEQVRRAKAQQFDDNQKLQKRVAELQRQLEKKTADDLGHWPELELYQSLQDEFQDDHVTRVGKGEEGADIVVEVKLRGESCGKIVVDSKNRKAWQNGYVDKLCQDSDSANAEYAVLATNVFPSGAKDLCLRDGVIVVRPQGVIPIVRILRTSLVSSHVRRLSMKQREEKAARVYEYINSSDFRQTLAAAVRACEQLEEIDVDEKRAHDNVWRKRGSLERKIAGAVGNAESRVREIVEAADDTARDLTTPRIA